MCEYERLVAMEGIDYVLIIGHRKILYGFNAVIVIASYHYLHRGRDLSYPLYAFKGYPVPGLTVFLVSDLIQKFKGKPLTYIAVSFCQLLPKFIEALLIFFRLKEAFLALSAVKGKATGLVNIEYHIETILFAPCYSPVDIFRMILRNLVIHRYPHVIKSP